MHIYTYFDRYLRFSGLGGSASKNKKAALPCLTVAFSRRCAIIRATPHNSARAGGEGFFLSRKFGKQRNTWCIPCFPNCADGEKDPPSGRRRFVRCCHMEASPVDAGDAVRRSAQGVCSPALWSWGHYTTARSLAQ